LPASSESLTEGSVNRHIFRLSGIMIVGFLAMTLGQLVEIIYLGIVGIEALAAIAFSLPIAMSLSALVRGVGVGASSIVARAAGEGDTELAARTTSHCYLLVLVLTISLSAIGYHTIDVVYSLIGAYGPVLTLVTEYTQVWFLGYPLIGFALVSNGIIRSMGNVRFAGFIMVSAPIVQICMGPFLIFGWLGLPAMGLQGAAWTSVAGAACQFLIACFWFLFNARMFRAQLQSLLSSWFDILYVGIPAAATNMIQPLSSAVTTWLLAGYGVSIVAGFGVASRIESVVAMVTIGVATSVVPIVGQNWGAKRFDRVRDTLRICYLACHGWGLVAALIMWSGAAFFVSLINDDPALVEPAVTFLYIVPISIGFMGMINVANHAFNAIRKPVPALLISIARLLVIYVPTAFVLGEMMGYAGIFVATVVTNVVVGVVALLWNRRTLQFEQHKLSALGNA
jgi:putative MATE family efflux protein